MELADDRTCSAVTSMVPENPERHLQLNATRLKRYDEVRVEIFEFFESRTRKIVRPRTREVASKAGSGDDPMDVESLITGNYKGEQQREKQRIWQAIEGSKQSKV